MWKTRIPALFSPALGSSVMMISSVLHQMKTGTTNFLQITYTDAGLDDVSSRCKTTALQPFLFSTVCWNLCGVTVRNYYTSYYTSYYNVTVTHTSGCLNWTDKLISLPVHSYILDWNIYKMPAFYLFISHKILISRGWVIIFLFGGSLTITLTQLRDGH